MVCRSDGIWRAACLVFERRNNKKTLQIIENYLDFHATKDTARQLRQLALPRNELPAPITLQEMKSVETYD